MKKCVLMSLLWLTALCVNADERSSALLNRLSSRIEGYGNYRVEFTVYIPGLQPQQIEGYYLVNGDKYYISVEDSEVYCDGKVKYEVNRADREVTIDAVNPAERNILSNPTRAFEFLDGSFTHSVQGEVSVGEKRCDRILLSPVDKTLGLSQVTLDVDRETGLPVRLSYRLEGASAPISIGIDRIVPHAAADPASFVFNRSKYKGFEMIDFR